MWILLTLAFVSQITSCGPGEDHYIPEKELTPEEKQEMLNEALKAHLDDIKEEKLLTDSVSVLAAIKVQEFYTTREYKFYWFNGTDTLPVQNAFLGDLDTSFLSGLPGELYNLPVILHLREHLFLEENFVAKADQIAQTEILLTNAFFLYTSDLGKGILDTASMTRVFKGDSIKINWTDYLQTSTHFDVVSKVHAFEPDYPEYCFLRNAFSNFFRKHDLSADTMSVPDPKKDSTAYWDVVRKALVQLELIDTSEIKKDSLVIEGLKSFQFLHALDKDGKPGKQTTASLKKSNLDRYLQGALALEKWRWKEGKRPGLNFHANIPAYQLNVIRNDSVLWQFRIVTGAPVTQTPEFSAKLRYVTLFPYWNVPHSIASTEFLWAVQRDTAYIRKNGYEVFIKKELQDPSTINWKKYSKDRFPFRIRQKGGPKNALGLIAFHFPNKYDVYMHDTPAKNLFGLSVRAFSHGCMRVKEPFKLGEIIMKEEFPLNTITADTLYRMAVDSSFEQRLKLKTAIPVTVDYITTSADSAGNVFFHLDIYGRDEKYLKVIRPAIQPK